MPISDVWDIVKVPFPYTDRPTRQHRPALIVSRQGGNLRGDVLWVLMITSAENRGWPGDIAIGGLVSAGLPVPSVIRTAKIATIEAVDASRLGHISPTLFRKVAAELAALLGLDEKRAR